VRVELERVVFYLINAGKVEYGFTPFRLNVNFKLWPKSLPRARHHYRPW
jgi:hypothetical protein